MDFIKNINEKLYEFANSGAWIIKLKIDKA